MSKFRLLFNRTNIIAVIILLLSLLVYWQLSHNAEINPLTPDGLTKIIEESGITAVLVYIGVIALAVVLSPIPGSTLTVAAGAIWGAIPAAIYSVIGGFLGGLVAYFIGKTLGRSAVKLLTGKIIYFSPDKGELYLGFIIFLTRLLPFFSFDLISYAAGISGVSLPIFILGTLLGMIPSTLVLTSIGFFLTINIQVIILFSIFLGFMLLVVPLMIKRYKLFNLEDFGIKILDDKSN